MIKGWIHSRYVYPMRISGIEPLSYASIPTMPRRYHKQALIALS